MDDQVSDNAEVLDAVNQQKDMISSYLMSKNEVNSTSTVIPATAPEKPDLLFKKDFLSAIDDLKKENVKKEEIVPTSNNQPSNPEETETPLEKDLTIAQEEELKKGYPEIDFNKPLGPNEDEEYTKGFKKRLYENLKEKEEKNKEIAKPVNNEIQAEQPLVSKKENNTPNVDNLDLKLKEETKNLPEPPSIFDQKNTAQPQTSIVNNQKTIIKEKLKSDEQPVKTVMEIKSNNIAEQPKTQTNIKNSTEVPITVSELNKPVQQSLQSNQQQLLPSKNQVTLNTPSIEPTTKKITENIPEVKAPEEETPRKNVLPEINPQVTQQQSNVAKSEETSQIKPDTRANLPAEDQSSQQPLKMANFSEVSLDELNKNIVSLNNNVNNISNMLANATSILANIASKEGNVTNINNMAGGGGNQPKQYQMIDGGIDGYRQSFRTPNNTNDVLGRTLTPNIPGVSYV